MALSSSDAGKFAAARRSVDFVENGMRVGLGTGSTAVWMVRALAARVTRDSLSITCVPTSRATADLAAALGLNVVSLDDAGWLDLTIDGADEFDPEFNLIKGGGGAHLREKLVAAATDRMIVITDPSKDVLQLGSFPLPIEVIPFGLGATRKMIDTVLEQADVVTRDTTLRGGETPFVTDEGNHIVDARLSRINDAHALSTALNRIPGVVENGLFLGMCQTVVIGHPNGSVEVRTPDGSTVSEVDLSEAETISGETP